MKNVGGLIAYAMAQYGSEPGKVKELTITKTEPIRLQAGM